MNYYFFLASVSLVLLGLICVEAQSYTKGKGSWQRDRHLDRLAGLLWGWALVCGAFWIDGLIG